MDELEIERVIGGNAVEGVEFGHLFRCDQVFYVGADVKILFPQVDIYLLHDAVIECVQFFHGRILWKVGRGDLQVEYRSNITMASVGFGVDVLVLHLVVNGGEDIGDAQDADNFFASCHEQGKMGACDQFVDGYVQ